MKREPSSDPQQVKGEKVSISTIDLGNGSEVVYVPRLLSADDSWKYLDYLDNHIPWIRPTIRPRDTCYIVDSCLQELVYSGYRSHAYSWDDYPPLKEILEAVRASSRVFRVQEVLPGNKFNSLLLNRYKGENYYAGWHADDEKLSEFAPTVASVSLGREREFLLKKRPGKTSKDKRPEDEQTCKRAKNTSRSDRHSFLLKHDSLLVMRGHTQLDWLHSVPKRVKVNGVRINLTFRMVI